MFGQTYSPKLFTGDDFKRLWDLFPSVRQINSSSLIEHQNSAGLIKIARLKEEIKQLIFSDDPEAVPKRLDLSQLAQTLRVEETAVIPLLPPAVEKAGWILDGDHTILTRVGYKALVGDIYADLRDGPVLISRFSQKHEISAQALRTIIVESNAIIEEHGNEAQKRSTVMHGGTFSDLIYTQAYYYALQLEVETLLKKADAPIEVRPASFTGTPPMKLLVQLVEAAVTDGTEGHKGIFEIQHDSVWYIPRAHLFKQQDTILEQFADSTLKSLSYSALTELDPDRRDGRQVITDRFQQEGVLLDSITVSRPFFEKILEHVEEEIRERGYAAPDLSIAESADDASALLKLLIQSVNGRSGNEEDTLFLAGNFIISKQFEEDFYAHARKAASEQARMTWNQARESQHSSLSKEDLIKELSTRVSPDILSLLFRGRVVASAEEAFKKELQRLEVEAAQEFSRYWNDRVMARLRLNQVGINALPDEKLRADLTATLLEYTKTVLIPDSLKKATEKDLIRGKLLRKNVESVKSSTMAIGTEVVQVNASSAALESALQSFNSSTKIPKLDEESVAQKKRQLITEMAGNMKRDKDVARLFLTLVLILLAGKTPGVVYATGKLAPRLLKQLGNLVEPELAEELKTIKDLVKAGNASEQTKERMRTMANEAVQQQ